VLIVGLELKPEKVFGEFTEMVSKQLDRVFWLTFKANRRREALQGRETIFSYVYSALNPNELKALVNVIESGNQINMEKYRDETCCVPGM